MESSYQSQIPKYDTDLSYPQDNLALSYLGITIEVRLVHPANAEPTSTIKKNIINIKRE